MARSDLRYGIPNCRHDVVRSDFWNWEARFSQYIYTNFLQESVDFEHFRVKDDWNHYPGMGSEVLAIHKFYDVLYIHILVIYIYIFIHNIYVYI